MKTKVTYLTMALVIALSMVAGGLLVAPPSAQAATAVTNVWVQFTQSTYNKTDTATDFTIHFTPTTAMSRGVDTITVWFPDGSTAMGPDNFDLSSAVTTASYYDVDPDGEVTTNSAVDVTSAAVLSTSGYRITVTTPVDLAAGTACSLRIEAAAVVKCADSTSHDPYYLKVYTSQDTTPVASDAFNIDATQPTDGTVALTLSPTTAGSAGQYSFEWTETTGLTAGSDTVSVIFPYGTTIPSSISADAISWSNDDASSWSTGTIAPTINQKARMVTCTTPITIAAAAGKWIKFSTAANIVNPTTADTYTDCYLFTSKDELQEEEASGYTITAATQTKLGFNNDALPASSYSDDATMINMYSSCMFVETQDTYGNLKDPDTEPTITFSTSGSGTFYTNSDGDGTGNGTFTQITTKQTAAGKAYIYYLPSAAGTVTITATASGYTDGTWTMYVAPGAELYDSNNNLIKTYAPLSTAPASETSASYAGSATKHGGTYVQDALNASTTGDTVKLGGSSGAVAIYEVDTVLSLAQKITLTSASAAAYTKLRPTTDAIHAINVTADGTLTNPVTISSLTFTWLRNNTEFDAAVMNNGYDYVTVDGCTFEYVEPDANTSSEAVVWTRSFAGSITSSTVSNNTFTNCCGFNAISGSRAGSIVFDLDSCGTNTMTGVTISGNTLTNCNDYGIQIRGNNSTDVRPTVAITNNTITNGYSSVNLSDYVATVTLTGNTITGGYNYGINVEGTHNTAVTIKNNTITGNAGYGVKVAEDGAVVTIQYNDISGNNTYAIRSTASTQDCKYNWYGDASGPAYTALTGATIAKSNSSGTGDKITDYVTYYPWLHTSKATVVSDNASYQTSTVDLVSGWNTLSTPVELIPAGDTIGELIPSGLSVGYYYDGGWQLLTTAYELSPCDAVYVKLSLAKTVQLKFDADEFTTPTKDLAAGWNLIGLAYLSSSGMDADDAVASVYLTAANLPGYSQVVSPSLNTLRRDMYYNQESSWSDSRAQHGAASGNSTMYATYGYWIYMLNAATLAGSTITPIAPDLD